MDTPNKRGFYGEGVIISIRGKRGGVDKASIRISPSQIL